MIGSIQRHLGITGLLSASGIAGLQNSTSESYYRNHTIPQHIPTTLSSFNSRTIMIGQGGEAKAFANCANILDSLTLGKTIMEVDFADHKAVAKCCSEEFQVLQNLALKLQPQFIVELQA